SSSRVLSSAPRKRVTSGPTSSSRIGTRNTEASRRSMITARPIAMPGEAAMPLYVRTSLRAGGRNLAAGSVSMPGSFYFVEFGVDQLLDGIDRLLLVFAVGGHGDHRPPPGGQKQNAENALAVDFFVAFAHFDVGFETRRAVNEFGGGACVKAELVLDLDVARDHPAFFSADKRSDATRMALEPFSLITCARLLTSLASRCIVANFTTIGRLTPVMISTRPF